MTAFIPGYQATVTLNSIDITAIGNVVRLSKTKAVMTKAVFGNDYANALGGQKLANFSASGHIDFAQIGALETMFEAASIAFALQIGTANTPTDAGLYTGNCIVSGFTLEASADGEWDWSLDAQTTGDVTYAAGSSSSGS